MIQTLHDIGTNFEVTPKMDGGIYGAGIADCVCKGIGDEFSLSSSSSSLTVQFSGGSQAVIGGAFFRTMSTTYVELDPNTTTYLCANIDLSRPNGYRGTFTKRTASNMQKDNINGTGTSRDLLLYIVTTNANGVISVQDKRVIKGDGGAEIADLDMTNINALVNNAVPVLTTAPTANYSGVGRKIVYLTSNPARKYDGYIYLIKES